LQKLVELTKTGQALRDRGFKVIVHGEGVGGAAGELQISLPGLGNDLLAESKRLQQATQRAAQSAIEKGTKQSSVLVIDGSAVGLSDISFDAAFAKFKRVSLARRIQQGAPITSGKIIFVNQHGYRIVEY